MGLQYGQTPKKLHCAHTALKAPRKCLIGISRRGIQSVPPATVAGLYHYPNGPRGEVLLGSKHIHNVGDSLDHRGLVARKVYLLTLRVKGLVFPRCLAGYAP